MPQNYNRINIRFAVYTASFVLFIVVAGNTLYFVNQKTPEAKPCSGIVLEDKCFNFYDHTNNWRASEEFCHSEGSELAQIATKEEMELLENLAGTAMHWIGLSREEGGPWKWTNGTPFNDLFEISGNGSFAFLNAYGVQSSKGYLDLPCICSKSKM